MRVSDKRKGMKNQLNNIRNMTFFQIEKRITTKMWNNGQNRIFKVNTNIRVTDSDGGIAETAHFQLEGKKKTKKIEMMDETGFSKLIRTFE